LLRQHGIAFTEHPYAFSLFATRRAMPVFVEEKILALPRIVINGGRRGHLVGLGPQVCVQLLGAQSVQCALAE
jgi:prolyl-tRNA editing enzyme YbaK/EbsC (Cys-tRNA(Pro) deacylase)